MYIIVRNHEMQYFTCKQNTIVSWSSNEGQAYGYKTYIGALLAMKVLIAFTGDTSLNIIKGSN